ncbi:PTS system mannose/fructose/sorbose family transporter subunit IID [Pseudonocardia acaciae]|uniref:PTS system mannose/fructose/sorbose family transporter subunit IID n=1 Tax=Pseudonocardia acaciae TaxID=551276 RepID=UPI00048FE4F7|nr:PTS system mannose/fructose/sorbose family transporter subunit IID [Pseudonocardia acaciae]
MSVSQSLLLAFIAGFAYFTRRFMGDLFLERAVVLGPLTGLILGDLTTGLVVGASLELIFIGAADIGGSVPPNLPIGSIVGTALAIESGLQPAQALVIAVPAALLGSFGELLAKAVSTVFVNGAERFAAAGNTRGISAMLHLGNLVHFLCIAVPAYLGLTLGHDVVSGLAASTKGPIGTGLAVAGAVLPALGFALLMNSLVTSALMPFFFIGFLLAAYTGFGVLGVALLGVMIAALWISRQGGLTLLRADDEDAGRSGEVVPVRDQRRLFWRSFATQSAFSFDRMQAIGFTWGLMPLLKRLYPERARLSEALRRHLVFFNTHPWLPGPIYALVAEMETRHAAAKEPEGVNGAEAVNVQTIQGAKGSLMGPLAGVGDSAIHGTLRPIFSGIGASLGMQANYLAPFVFLLPVNAVHLVLRWLTVRWGFRWGSRLFERMDAGALRRLMEGASITGLMGVGALVGTWLVIKVPITYTEGKATVKLQEMLDHIMPKLVPLLITLAVFWLVRRRANAVLVLIGLAVGGFALGALGVLGVPS